MNAVGIHQFTMIETVDEVFVVIDRTAIRLLDRTSRWSIVTGDSQTNHRTIRQIDRTLHQAFAERTAAYNNSSVPILYRTADNFAGGSCILVHQYDEAAITEVSVTFGIEITTLGGPTFGIYNQFFLSQEFVGKVNGCIEITASVSLQVKNHIFHSFLLEVLHCFFELFGSCCSEAVDTDITRFRLNHIRGVETKDRYLISLYCKQ